MKKKEKEIDKKTFFVTVITAPSIWQRQRKLGSNADVAGCQHSGLLL